MGELWDYEIMEAFRRAFYQVLREYERLEDLRDGNMHGPTQGYGIRVDLPTGKEVWVEVKLMEKHVKEWVKREFGEEDIVEEDDHD